MFKRNFLVALTLGTAIAVMSAQTPEATTDTSQQSPVVTPFFSFTDTSTLTVTESVDSYENEVEDMTLGLNVNVNDKLTISPYLCNTFDFAVDSTTDTVVGFGSDALEFGIGFSVTPTEFFALNLGVSNNYEFIPLEHTWFGGNGLLGIGLTFDKVHFALSIEDNLNPMFQKANDETTNFTLENELAAELNFNFFNFVNENLNSGLWVSNTLTTTSEYENSSLSAATYENELYAGFLFNPYEFFDGSVAFYSLNDWGDEKAMELGLYAGVTFYYNAVSFNMSYTPVFYSTTDDEVNDTMTHSITASISVNL